MALLDEFFDRSGTVSRPPYRRLFSEFASLILDHPARPDPIVVGGGHVVLVIPAFLTTDLVTRQLRQFLAACGYRVFGWDLGVNWGPTPRLLIELRRRLGELRAREGGPIGVVGVSLGGLLARDLAYDCPADIRQVITIASPIRLPTACSVETLFRLCAPFYSPSIDVARFARPLPVPSTAVYTRDDGLVAWQSCIAAEPDAVAVEVRGSHITICRNPDVLRSVAERLAI